MIVSAFGMKMMTELLSVILDVGSLALIVIIIVVFMVILKRKTSYAYDPTLGKYVKMDKGEKEEK